VSDLIGGRHRGMARLACSRCVPEATAPERPIPGGHRNAGAGAGLCGVGGVMCVVCLTDISVPEPYMRANQIPCLASFAPLGAAIALPLELPLALGRIRMGRSNALPPGSTVADVLGLVRGAVKKRRGCGKSLTPAETFEVGSLWVRGTAWGPARASRGSAAGADGLRRAVAEQRPYTRSPTRPAGGRSDRATRCPSNDPIRGRRAGRIAAESCVAAGLVGRAVDCGMRTPSNDPIRGRWTGRIAAESCVAADLVGKAGLRNGDAEQRPYTRPAGRGMSRR